MSNAGQQLLEFQCPKCSKKLKANREVAGKRVKCPQCAQTVKVPGDQTPAPANDDWLSLDAPSEPNSATLKAIASSTNSKPRSGSPRAQSLQARSPAPQKQSTQKTTATPQSASREKSPTSQPAKHAASSPRRTVFDEDLPELSAYSQSSEKPSADLANMPGSASVGSHDPLAGLGSFDDLGNISMVTPEIEAQAQYRITCKSCDTPQYVTLAQQGQTIQCPDCFGKFVVPGPPPNWKPTKAASVDDWGKGGEVRLAPVEAVGAQQEVERERQRATDILKKAQLELDDEIDEMVGTDFDTKGFVEKTFGFVTDPTAVMLLVVYGCLFALLFGASQFCVDRMVEGDRGFALLLVILVPTFAGLVCLPMLSGGMALLESVANGRRRVAEWPSFNLFDNLSDILLMGAALGGSMLLGLIAGGLIGRVFGSYWIILVTIVGTTFLLFPIFLLSMLDNGSMFQPFSTQVFRSITGGGEAWGAYYIKTLFGFFCVQVAWFLLLGRNPVTAAIGGFLLPWLLFFTCQQIGTLAQAIAEHLSFEFADDDDLAQKS